MKANCPYGILHKKLFELQQLLHYVMCRTDAETQQINGSIIEEIPQKLCFLKTLLGVEMEIRGSSKVQQADHLQQIADWLYTIEAWSNAQPKGGVFAPPFCSVCAKDEEGFSDLCLCTDSCFDDEGIDGGDSGGDGEEVMTSVCERRKGGRGKVCWNKSRVVGILFAVAVTVVGIMTRFCFVEEDATFVPT